MQELKWAQHSDNAVLDMIPGQAYITCWRKEDCYAEQDLSWSLWFPVHCFCTISPEQQNVCHMYTFSVATEFSMDAKSEGSGH